MELTRDHLKVAFSSNSIIREIFTENQSAEGKRIFYLLHFLAMRYLRRFSVAFAICICNLWIGTGCWPRNLGSMWQ